MAILAGALFAAAISTAAAQHVRGRVVLADSVTPAVGAIVVATDERGAVAERTLTNERGNFNMRFTRAGRYSLRVLRIGFRPTIVPPFTLGRDELREITVVATGESVALPAVMVRGDNVCRIRQDSGQLVARLWEEARKAISSTQLTAVFEPLQAEWFTYDRATDISGEAILAEQFRSQRGATDRPFISRSPDSLARFGYVTNTRDETEYHGPDADALLSDEFAAGHCFHAEPAPKAHPEWIGIGFRPARHRSDVIDIEGTLWLDRASAELRLLEYRYAGVRREFARVNVGGEVEFLRLPTGNWLVNRWAIRMPRAQMVVTETRDRAGFPIRTKDVEIQGLKITGGEVERVERAGLLVYTTGERRHDPTRDAAARAAAGDSLPRQAGTVTSAGNLGIGSACGEAPDGVQLTALHGVVLDQNGLPVVGAVVDLRWQSEPERRYGVKNEWAFQTMVRTVATGALGVWLLCDVPRNRLLWLRASLGERTSSPMTVLLKADREAATIDIRLPER